MVHLIVMLLLLVATFAQGQTTGVRLTEIAVPNYNSEDVLGVYNNAEETFLVLGRDANGSGRILYKKSSEPFADVDLSLVRGGFKRTPGTSSKLAVAGFSHVVARADGLYFTTSPASFADECGGSYRIKAGKVEALVFSGQEIDLKTLDGVVRKAKVRCATTASPLEGADVLLWVNVLIPADINQGGGMAVRKQGNLYTTLFQTHLSERTDYQYPYTVGYPFGDLGVWGKGVDVYITRSLGINATTTISHFSIATKKFTDVYRVAELKGQPVIFWSYAQNALTGEPYLKLVTKDGDHVVTVSKEKGVEEIFTIPNTFPEFGPLRLTWISNSMSREMALFGIMPTKPSGTATTFDGIGVWKKGAPTSVILQTGKTLPSGRTVPSLHPVIHTDNLSVAGCTGLAIVYRANSIKLDALVEVKTCVEPLTEPQISAITDLNGVVGPAAPGKLHTIYGTEFCTVRTIIPIAVQTVVGGVVPADSSLGCRVLIDSKPVGLYFAWTSTFGQSQINLLVPNEISSGSHELQVQRFEIRNGQEYVVATSKPFGFKVEDVSPTFFKPYTYPITLQNTAGRFVSEDEPAMPDDVLVAYLSGGGRTLPALPERTAGIARFTKNVRIWAGDVECTVFYAGTQSEYPGLEQINFQLPRSIRAEEGMVTLKIEVDSAPAKEFRIHLGQ